MRKGARGFTLIELIIALAISVFVLIGIISVVTTMIRYQYDSTLKGSVAGGSLYSLQRMQKELEEASRLTLPANGAAGDVIAGVVNWSDVLGARIDVNRTPSMGCTAGNNVTGFYYCVNGNVLYRHYTCGTTCPSGSCVPSPTCGSGSNVDVVVPAKPGIFRMDNYSAAPCSPPNCGYFKRQDSSVELHYIVGVGTYSSTNVNPNSVKINVVVTTNRTYGGTAD